MKNGIISLLVCCLCIALSSMKAAEKTDKAIEKETGQILFTAVVKPSELRKIKEQVEILINIEFFPSEFFPLESLEKFQSVNISTIGFEMIINKKELAAALKKGNSYKIDIWLPVNSLTDENDLWQELGKVNNGVSEIFLNASMENKLKVEGFKDGKKYTLGDTYISVAEGNKINKWDYFAGGEEFIISSSHNDIAWKDSPAKTIEWRDKGAITPALERMKNRDDVYFDMECVLYLHEYLERQPQRQEEVYKKTASGNLGWGATYNQPYESLLSGEQLVREVYLGAKEIRKMIPGATARVAYSPDVPGRAIQMPQILAKANVPYFLISRFEASLFHWVSPDGSSILCWSVGGYGNTYGRLRRVSLTDEFLNVMGNTSKMWQPFYEKHNIPPIAGIYYSADYIGPFDGDKFIDSTKMIRNKMKENGLNEASPYFMPTFKYSSTEKFLDKIAQSDAQLDTIKGERPNVWAYINGPTHHKAIDSKRSAGILLPAAEVFTTVSSILKGSFTDYQQKEFNEAWAASIYDDHGWGGYNGHITDEVFKEKLDFAKEQGHKLLDIALTEISDKVNTNDQKGQAIILYNALSWKRTDPVEVKIKSKDDNFGIIDYSGKKVAHQIISNENGEYLISFIAENVPSFGYKTYYVSGSGKAEKTTNALVADNLQYENEFYRLKFGNGGLDQIFDKQLNQELIKRDKFKAGEIFTMQSVGSGTNDPAEIHVRELEMYGFDKVSLHGTAWKLAANGSVYAKYEVEQQLEHCSVKEQIIVYHKIKRIDFKVSLLGWDGTKYREFRLALPLNMNMKDSKVTYEVPMGTVTIGKDEIESGAGENYTSESKNIRCREVQNFISTNNSNFGVTMSSSVAVFDRIDPTDNPVDYAIIQPVLLASRRSAHGEGNWYLQEGDHNYSFSIFSHEAGWENGYKQAIQANNPIIPVFSKSKKGNLPAEKSFFSVSTNNILISTIKKCEDDNSVVVRLYDIEGKDSNVTLNTFFPIDRGEHTNIIENAGKTINTSEKLLETKIGHHAIETFKLIPSWKFDIH